MILGLRVWSSPYESAPPWIMAVHPDGVVAEYNERCVLAQFPDDVVRRGEEILQVNGVVYTEWEPDVGSLLQRLGDDEVLFMVLRRARPRGTLPG